MTTPMPVEERESLGRQYAAELAPQLRSAINRRDASRIAELTLGLDRQELLALVVVLASEWPTSAEKPKRRRTFVFCRDCGEWRRHESRGRCGSCHARWDTAGRPDSGPPPAMSREEAGRCGGARIAEKREQRLEDYADLASWGVSDEEAARRLGVRVETICRYKAAVRRGAVQLGFPADREYQEAS